MNSPLGYACRRDARKLRASTQMFNNRRQRQAEQQEAQAEQRRREDAAPRLRDVIPELTSLRLHVRDEPSAGRNAAWPYTRHLVVATTPALFTIRCTEPTCDGRHELTGEVLRGLRARATRIEGESSCNGTVSGNGCDRKLVYVYEAEYRA